MLAVLVAGLLLWQWKPMVPAGISLRVGQEAPATEFRFIDGRVEQLAQMRGQPVLINFWATSCAICLAEMPDVVALQREFAGRFRLVAVAMPYDRADRVLDYQRRVQPELPIALDPLSRIVNNWGPVLGTPTRVLIDRQGRIAHYSLGAIKPATLRGQLQALLDEAA